MFLVNVDGVPSITVVSSSFSHTYYGYTFSIFLLFFVFLVFLLFLLRFSEESASRTSVQRFFSVHPMQAAFDDFSRKRTL